MDCHACIGSLVISHCVNTSKQVIRWWSRRSSAKELILPPENVIFDKPSL